MMKKVYKFLKYSVLFPPTIGEAIAIFYVLAMIGLIVFNMGLLLIKGVS
jgi:hypothetical protein